LPAHRIASPHVVRLAAKWVVPALVTSYPAVTTPHPVPGMLGQPLARPALGCAVTVNTAPVGAANVQ
jgi:hypothetical protein